MLADCGIMYIGFHLGECRKRKNLDIDSHRKRWLHRARHNIHAIEEKRTDPEIDHIRVDQWAVGSDLDDDVRFHPAVRFDNAVEYILLAAAIAMVTD